MGSCEVSTKVDPTAAAIAGRTVSQWAVWKAYSLAVKMVGG